MAENDPKVESEVPGTHNIRGDATPPTQNVETTKPRIISSFIEVHPEVNDGEKVVRRHQVIRNGDNGTDSSTDEKTQTKIPITKLRQTVEKVKAKRQNSMEKAKKEFESQIPIRRTSLTKTTDAKRTTEDEFDKLYEEVVKDDTPVKALETKFDEIIHDYDENKLQPIDVDKVRRSKIPFLKRRSLQDAEGTHERNNRIMAAREKVKLRKSISINDEKYEQISQAIVGTIEKEKNENLDGNKGSIEIIQGKNEIITVDSPVIYTNNETGEVKLKIDSKTDNSNSTASKDDSNQKEVNLEQDSSTKIQREVIIIKTISVEQDDDVSSNITQKTTSEITTTEISERNAQIQENEIKNFDQIETPVIKSDIDVQTETNKTSYESNEGDLIENKLNNITIETEKLSEDIKTFARTNSKEFETNLITMNVETTKSDIVYENTKNINVFRIENEEKPSETKAEFNNNFIDSYLRSRSRNFDTKFDDNIKLNSPKLEKTEIEFNYEKSDQKDEEFLNQFFETPFDKNNKVYSFKNETSVNFNNVKQNKIEIKDTLSIRDKVEHEKRSKKEKANKYEAKERDDEFVTTFKGKVGRLISRMDSKEQIEFETPKELPELPKKKTVLSKIAMFESLESETPAKAKPKPKPLKLITKDIKPEVKAHVHVHTPLIVNEIFKPFYNKHDLKTNIEPLNESENEKHIIEDDKELYSATADASTNDLTDLNPIKDVNEHIFAEEINQNDDISNVLQKPYNYETYKDKDTKLDEVKIANTPNDKTKHFQYENPEPNTPINNAPVIIPKVRPVREILSKFEPKYKNIDDNEVFHKGTFRSKVKEALDELKQADIDVKHILQVNKDETTESNVETTKIEEKELKFDTKAEKRQNQQDFNKNFDLKSIKSDNSIIKTKVLDTRRTTSVADLYPGQAKGKVSNIIVKMKSYDIMELAKKEVSINIKEMPRKRSVSEKIALFERKLIPIHAEATSAIPSKIISPIRSNLSTTISPAYPSPTTTKDPIDPYPTTHVNPTNPNPITTNGPTYPNPTTIINPTDPNPTTLINPTEPNPTTTNNPTYPSPTTTINPFDTNTTTIIIPTETSPITTNDPTYPSPTTTINPFDTNTTTIIIPTETSPITTNDPTYPSPTTTNNPIDPYPTTHVNPTHSNPITTNDPTHPNPITTIDPTNSNPTTINPTEPDPITTIDATNSGITTINPTYPSSTHPTPTTNITLSYPNPTTTINPTHPSHITTKDPTYQSPTALTNQTEPNPITTNPIFPTHTTHIPPTHTTINPPNSTSPTTTTTLKPVTLEDKLKELTTKYPAVEVPTLELSNGLKMPVIAVGTANLEPVLTKAIIYSAIDMGYRAIDSAYIYGNEQAVGEAIRDKIQDGTVKREDLFVISKLWSTFHREDLVETACNNSLNAMGLDYFDLYLIHNPMSFKEGPNPLPKIATVLQYSTNDYMNAWYGMEPLVAKGLVKGIGVSNFNSTQVARVMEKGRVKPVVNQVECHPYLSQEKLDDFCAQRNIALSCFGVLGSKGTPPAYRGTPATVIDDPLVKVMATALRITPAQLLIAYQLKSERTVVVKSSSAAHLWDNLQALKVNLTDAEMSGLRLMHRNKRIFTFAGMGDTHKNYPFNIVF